MTAPSNCLECDAPLSPADTGGVCPKCLLKLGLASQLATGSLPATAKGLRSDGTIEEPFDFGGYRILRLLGKGGMGAVYEAEQTDTGRRVALKVLGQSLDTPEMRQRFLREGQLAASVRHGNVVTVLAAGEVEAIPVIVMELLRAGTLKDAVSHRGPLPPREAVDIVLQIVAGLEAAHAAGVLHRDIKPANCFRNEDGTVKVGDFGLSISTLIKAEHSLTQSGAVLGTPAFAAPEQLRGEEVDARADIYAVGATLYYLLTGKSPFEDESLVALIASVLEKPPVDVALVRPGIPADLRAIVMRCLEKQRDRRFRDYADLRAALAPYSSAAPTPGTIGLRFAAGTIDTIGTLLPAITGLALWNDAFETYWVGHRTWPYILAYLGSLCWIIGWFGVPEGLWGRSLGKLLCGLRVVAVNGHPISIPVASARAAIFCANAIITPLVMALIYSEDYYRKAVQSGEWLHTDWLWFFLVVVLFITMRRSNGYAAVHDLLTGTRVVEDHGAHHSIARAEPFMPEGMTASSEPVGPFVLLERKAPVAEAFDPVLRRRVWILFRENGAPAVSERRRELARSARLRWLQGSRSVDGSWDAFERPNGAPLLDRKGANESWQTARVWLADLADEFHAGLADGTLPDALSLSHVWITESGHAVLLDFLAPGSAVAPARAVTNAEHVQQFLQDAADLAVSPLMPLHARAFLTACRERRFEAAPIVAGNVRALAERRATVDPRRRALSAFLPFLLLLALFAMLGAMTRQARSAFDVAWTQQHPGIESPRLPMEIMTDAMNRGNEEPAGVVVHLARKYGSSILGDEFWESAPVEGLESFDLVSRSAVEYHVAAELGRIEKGGGRPAADPGVLGTLLERQKFYRSGLVWPISFALIGAAVACVVGVFIALTFRVSFMLRMFGFAVVRRDGAPAERWRIAARSRNS